MSEGRTVPAAIESAAAPRPLAVASPDSSAAAFFDVDNTMMVGASIFHFARGMAARGLFTWQDVVRFALRQTRLRMRGETRSDLRSARDLALAFVAGKRVDEIVALGEEIYDEEMADRVWSGTRALAERHLADGQRVWLVTATPVELATIIARRLGLTGAVGTVAESVDGTYTGYLVGNVLHGEDKAQAVRGLAAREGLDLRHCFAYSDSINDLPMLTAVGHPVAVNPDSALRAEARRHGWPIRDFRTGRKAARVGIPGALGAGLVGGAIAVGMAIQRERDRRAAAARAASRPRWARLRRPRAR
ncbi:MAG: hypothetical protein QOD45_140 [Pseudonocardiales bacterium]|nr:hypothetical protein [Pseudonocardiales bacterium]